MSCGRSELCVISIPDQEIVLWLFCYFEMTQYWKRKAAERYRKALLDLLT